MDQQLTLRTVLFCPFHGVTPNRGGIALVDSVDSMFIGGPFRLGRSNRHLSSRRVPAKIRKSASTAG